MNTSDRYLPRNELGNAAVILTGIICPIKLAGPEKAIRFLPADDDYYCRRDVRLGAAHRRMSHRIAELRFLRSRRRLRRRWRAPAGLCAGAPARTGAPRWTDAADQ